jgi:hypothetical protein
VFVVEVSVLGFGVKSNETIIAFSLGSAEKPTADIHGQQQDKVSQN